MQYSQHHAHGGDAWGSQCFAQLAQQHCQSTASQYPDVSPSNGGLSEALKHKLAEEDVLDLEVLLRYRGIRTLRALENLNTEEKAVLLCKSRQLFELLGIFPSNLKNTLNKLFDDLPQQAVFQRNPWAEQVNGIPYMQPQWPAHGGWGQHQIEPGGPEPLTDPLEDDTHVMRCLRATLLRAKKTIGLIRYKECWRRLKRSEELAVTSCREAAEALASLEIEKQNVRDREGIQALKDAKRVVRDVFFWRCTGSKLGLDSKACLVRAFEASARHTNCGENLVAQLTLAHKRILEELAGLPAPKRRIAASPDRRTQELRSNTNGQQQPHQQQQQAADTVSADASSSTAIAAAAEEPRKIPALIDPMEPNSSDPILPHPSDPIGLHDQRPVLVKPAFACPPGLDNSMFQGEMPTERRSLPPTRRSPGPRSRDGVNGLQMAQMMEMSKAILHQLHEVKAQVGKLMQDRDPLPFRPVIPFNDDDEDS